MGNTKAYLKWYFSKITKVSFLIHDTNDDCITFLFTSTHYSGAGKSEESGNGDGKKWRSLPGDAV